MIVFLFCSITLKRLIGTSGASEMVEAKTKGQVPESPPLFQFVTTNSSQATLYLTQWEAGGCPITHFNIQFRKTSNKQWALGKIYKFFFRLHKLHK